MTRNKTYNFVMGRASRVKPARLGEKLRTVRKVFGLSQDGILIKLGLRDASINRSSISGYELGEREPSLLTLYAYAKLANVYMEVLVDDSLNLPDRMPCDEKSVGLKKR
jgi:transcriptional regulator with XRE-family HTH domain